MNILITGNETNISQYMRNYFTVLNHNCIPEDKKLDITKKDSAFNEILNLKPDIVIHVDSKQDIDACESDESSAYKNNTISALNVAYPCSILDIPIIYLSTSYVYKGNSSRCNFETDECVPVNVYGKTKLAGEKLIRTLCRKYFIIRAGWIFGQNNCFVDKLLKNHDFSIFLCSTEIGNPTYIGDLCRVINEMLNSNLYGIYNCANGPSTSKSTWVKKIFKFSKIERKVLEIPENFISNAAKRPHNSSVSTALVKNCFNVDFPSWETRLLNYLKSKK
ncbi:MAG: sugar nucleotide-binding protein [Clostridium sp.]|nr:sugar nucleotide-binding protein [Clostridium sp.]